MAANVKTMLEVVDRFEHEHDFSGVCFIQHHGEIVVHEPRGLAHRGFAVPNTVDTRFDVASVTKLFTAAAILQLVDSGQLTLDTRLLPYLGVDAPHISPDVTLYHCLTHTSGIGDDADEEAGEDYELLFVDRPNYSIRETRDFLPQCTTREANFPLGEGHRYNNCAFVLTGLVIEEITGLSYRDYVRQNIFEPAGLTGSDFCAWDGTCSNLAEHYKKIVDANGGVEWRKNIYSYPPVGSPDGGATVTASDLNRFMQSIMSGALMSSTMSQAFLTPQVKTEDISRGRSLWNGFGSEIVLRADGSVELIAKDGENPGVASIAAWYPDTDSAIILLANKDCDVWKMHDELESILMPNASEEVHR